jgi:hypothetical protein
MTKKKLPNRRYAEQDKRIERAVKIVREILEDDLPDGTSFEEYEKNALEIANEIVRRELERKLQTIADGFPDELRIDHNNDWHGWREGTAFDYRKHLPGTVMYHSLVGGLQITRYTYRENYRNAPTYVPLELEAGLMEHMTPCLARCVTRGFADLPMRRFEPLLLAAGRQPPSRSTLERCANDLGSYAVAANDEIEPEVRASETVPVETRSVVLGLDRVSVPMRPSDTHVGMHCIGRSPRNSRPWRNPNSANGSVQWRMDYVGTITFVDKDGERLAGREYRLPSDVEPALVVTRVMADLRHALTQCPRLQVAVVQDGAPELWNALTKALRAEPLVNRFVEILDWYHLDERLTKCLDLCLPTPERRETQRARWHKLLMCGGTMQAVTSSMRRYGRNLDSESREELGEHIRYLARQTRRTHYCTYKKRGLPIGSGGTEGVCKSLVSCRAKRSGQRWSQRGLTAALHLRSLEESERFEQFWPLFAQRYCATSMTPLEV